MHLPGGGTRPAVCHEGPAGLCSFLPPTSSSTALHRGWARKQRGQKSRSGHRKIEPSVGGWTWSTRRAGVATHCVCAGEMTPRVWAAWLPSAVFLLQAPGCLSVSGPPTMRGTVGGSLSVQCRYEELFRRNKKYWCEKSCLPLKNNKIVETTESEREVRNGRVTIRDHPENLTFTVTMENLTEDDGGAYRCGIDVSLNRRILDPAFEVVVTVYPAPTTTQKIFASTLGPPSSLTATTLLSTTWPETPDPRQHPRSLLSSVHFLLLVFLKLPVFLSMLGAVLWVPHASDIMHPVPSSV
ncbi:CMRF35-like molecule 6 isoform X2 [Phyllostomus hastatus]|uniref:CMRF35-like molecule 6 isoform X2 n=1 Tax=Phyllostomus hastatus TaxID=9423 RepID=UPI001E684BF7|nr:CMRF35-like molecule 6 isoform X2 [Phyllostomus hastatus]